MSQPAGVIVRGTWSQNLGFVVANLREQAAGGNDCEAEENSAP
jgi:hypothetical protein